MTSNLHGAARQWATFIPIFPCLPNEKKPATPNGFKDATANIEQIDEWWTKEPTYNIAACPDQGNCFVLDVDGPEGEEALHDWEMLHGALPASLQVRTPRGGRHIWLRGSRPSSVSKWGNKIDVRGRGGYVLLPPSIVDGREYVFIA